MKVLFTIDSLAQGGTEQSLAELIRYFSNDVQVTVVYFYDAHQLRHVFENLPCKLIYFDIRKKYGFYSACKKLANYIYQEKPDIVVSSLYRSLIISRLVCFWYSIPLVGTFVNTRYSSQRKGMFKGLDFSKYFLTWYLDRITSFIPKAIISNSYSIALQNGKALSISRKKIKVIYRGRDSLQIIPWEKISPNPEFKWVSIGRLIPQKGFESLLNAIQRLKSRGYLVSLDIIGDGSLRNELLALINKLGIQNDVRLLGNIPNAWQELYKSNAFVISSNSEGFSGALVEALMSGIPIVASDIPMNLEAISPGRFAYIFKTGSVDDLVSQMQQLMNNYDQACEVGKIFRSRAIDNYDIRFISLKYETALRNTLKNLKK
jgi:glycosyltransferase involved in cell wall biosynthesis